MGKVRLATTWLDACAGCHMSFLDIDEAIIEVAKAVEFTRSPITDIKEFAEVDVGLITGAIGTFEHEEEAKELREKCKILIVLGDCACFGGIPSMRNAFSKDEVLRRAYIESESTKDGRIPSSPEIPALLEKALPVTEVVKVDCFVPGCPPRSDAILYALKELLQGRIPVLPREMMRFD
ncbi:MAG: NADP oxidoreductase [Dehalococcoidia bacterium]|nr:MAG: NADP oxidoreductase [Dehalococcoidia bacterium]UCG82884.1 MAG: NADP oxidoreductase [Dehalococcoidia bacterium]